VTLVTLPVSVIDSKTYTYTDLTAAKGSIYEYQVVGNGTSSCGTANIQSLTQNTIHLKASSSESGSTASASISWNSFVNWPAGVVKYRIFRSENPDYGLTSGPVFELIDSTVINTTTQSIDTFKLDQNLAANVLSIIYRVEAISGDGTISWSDTVAVTLVRSIKVFNTFTPNGDGLDENFSIQNIEAYPNEIYIFNRWGQTVYYQKNYQNNWGGSNLPEGTYYYTLNYSDPSSTGGVSSDGKYAHTQQGYIMLLR
jgi:gliding motility-associated-like protein